MLANAIACLVVVAIAQDPPPAGFRGVPAEQWIERLRTSTTDAETKAAIEALSTLVPENPALARTILPLFADVSGRVRRAAARCLIDPSAVPALTKALESDDTTLRWDAACTLARIGPPAAPARNRMLEIAAAEAGGSARHRVHRMLVTWGRADLGVLPEFLQRLGDGTPFESLLPDALASMGPVVIPHLFDALHDERRQHAAVDTLLLLARDHAVDLEAVAHSAPEHAGLAMHLHKERARRDAAAVPAFMRAFVAARSIRNWTSFAASPAVDDALVQLLRDEDTSGLHFCCLLAMATTGPLPRSVPGIARVLELADQETASFAARALVQHAIDAPDDCLPELIVAVRSGDSGNTQFRVDCQACLALGTLARTHTAARDTLRELARDDEEVGAFAAFALAKNVVDDPLRRDWLQRSLTTSDHTQREKAIALVGNELDGSIGPALARARRVLGSGQDAPDDDTVIATLQMLDAYDAAAAPLAHLVVEHCRHPNAMIAAAAVRVLPGLTPACPDLLDAVRDLTGVQPAAMAALGGFGGAAQPDLPLLIEHLASGWPMASYAEAALRNVGPIADDLLLEALAADDPDSETDAARRVAAVLHARKAESLPALERAVRDPRPAVRGHAIDCLGRIEALRAQAKAPLLAGLRDEHWFVRGRAVRNLDALGDAAPSFAPFLLDPDGYVRAEARRLAERREYEPRRRR